MKNLFKNLMLVAVAAMAFTACQNDSNEVNEVAKKTVLDFVATIANQDDTRSGFTGTYTEGEDTYYQSGWDGDETFIVCANGNFNANNTVAIEDAEGHFSVAFEGNVPTFIDVYSPASAWNSQHTPTVPAVQTPRANSVDPAAHILKAEGATVATGMVDMKHKVAYGKMTVNTPADFEISKVELSLVGLPYSSWTDNQTYSYTINANEVEGNVFWFATETMQIVKEFTVTAYNAENQAYSKTVTGLTEGKLAFIVGQVSTFSVSNLEAVVVPEEPEEPEEPESIVFNQARVTGDSGDVYAYFYTANGDELKLNPYYVFVNSTWPVGTHVIKSSQGYVYPGLGQQYSAYNGVDVEGGEIVVSVKNKMYYIEFNNLVDGNNNILIEKAIFEGQISGLQVPDPRVKLAIPDASATVDGKTISISWGAVEGADGYRVKLYSPYDEYLEEIVNATEYVYEAQLYNTSYSFTIMSYANDENVTYKSSDDEYVDVVTGKDPNGPIAEYMATELKWKSNDGGYFEFVTDHYEIFRVKMHDSDCPDHKTIKEGNYTAVASSTVGVGQFSVYQKVRGGYAEGWSSTKTTSTMSVKYVDGEYVIVVNYIGAWGGSGEVGYKGVPDGWVVPGDGGDSGEGGDEPVDPTPTPDPEPDQPTESYSHVFTSCKCVNNMDMGEGWGAKFELSNDEGLFLWLWVIQTSVNQSTGAIATGTYNFHNQWCDKATQPGFVVKKMRLPGHGDEEFGLIGATFKSTLNGTVNDLEFVVTFEDNSTETYTFNGTVQRAW